MNTALGKSLSVLHTLKHGGTCRFSCESPPPSEKAPSKSKKTCDHLDEIKTPKESSAHASRDPEGPMLPAAGKKKKNRAEQRGTRENEEADAGGPTSHAA